MGFLGNRLVPILEWSFSKREMSAYPRMDPSREQLSACLRIDLFKEIDQWLYQLGLPQGDWMVPVPGSSARGVDWPLSWKVSSKNRLVPVPERTLSRERTHACPRTHFKPPAVLFLIFFQRCGWSSVSWIFVRKEVTRAEEPNLLT